MQKIILYIKSSYRQFARYFVVGISGVLLDMGTLILFKEGWQISATLGVIFNQMIVLVYNFLLNKYWSFKNRDIPHKQFVRYMILAGANYVFSVLVMFILADKLYLDYRLVRIATIALMVSWNFLLYKHWVFKGFKNDKKEGIIP